MSGVKYLYQYVHIGVDGKIIKFETSQEEFGCYYKCSQVAWEKLGRITCGASDTVTISIIAKSDREGEVFEGRLWITDPSQRKRWLKQRFLDTLLKYKRSTSTFKETVDNIVQKSYLFDLHLSEIIDSTIQLAPKIRPSEISLYTSTSGLRYISSNIDEFLSDI